MELEVTVDLNDEQLDGIVAATLAEHGEDGHNDQGEYVASILAPDKYAELLDGMRWTDLMHPLIAMSVDSYVATLACTDEEEAKSQVVAWAMQQLPEKFSYSNEDLYGAPVPEPGPACGLQLVRLAMLSWIQRYETVVSKYVVEKSQRLLYAALRDKILRDVEHLCADVEWRSDHKGWPPKIAVSAQ